jgi:Uma2 family endonuclease
VRPYREGLAASADGAARVLAWYHGATRITEIEEVRMATADEPAADELELHNGDHLTQQEFHRIYARMPEDFKAELIGGIVYVASPLKVRHGTNHSDLNGLFWTYAGHTPGVECGDNTTVLLGDAGEPQPDLYLRILPEYGGQSRTTAEDYVKGPPELIAEVAHSSTAIDLHGKRDDYARHGVLEYLVLNLRDNRLHWFDLRAGRELAPDADGVCRVRTFPGLWIDGPALLARDFGRMMATLTAGLATPDHAAFVQRLQQARGAAS